MKQHGAAILIIGVCFMKTTGKGSYANLHSRYLDWFRERAGNRSAPWDEEDFPRFQSFHEDVYENDRILLNRVYYSIPLSPSDSLSGKLEVFSFSELNLMEKDGDDIIDICPVEYRLE